MTMLSELTSYVFVHGVMLKQLLNTWWRHMTGLIICYTLSDSFSYYIVINPCTVLQAARGTNI